MSRAKWCCVIFWLVSEGVFNEVMPIVLSNDSAAIKASRHKRVASLYVHGERFGARVLSLVRMAEPLLLW